ncbi:MAG: glycosyltransferase family 39 protein [Myxococcales bacterium]|nr:MAG: glycosyltransferase family 39 protein [Myxococcales bacterium]
MRWEAIREGLAAWDDPTAETKLPFWKRREVALSVLVVLIGLALYLPKLGSYYFWDPWEPHYSQVAMEMEEKGDWLVPHYRHSDKWFSKPILFFWLTKPSFLLFGQTEFAGRLPIMLLAVAGLALFNLLVGRLFSWRTGLLASLILATSPQWFFISRQSIFDGPYVVFQTTALLLLYVGLFVHPDRSRWIYGFWIVSGVAMLTKGLLAIMLPASAIGTYVLISWDWAILKRMRFLRGLAVFFVVAAPWYAFMTAKFGWPYFKSFFIYHHFERAAGMISKPNDSFERYVAQIFYATFPWSAFLPVALVRFLTYGAEDVYGRTRRNLLIFLSFAMPYILFTLSSTKFNHYIFPVVPFLAIMIAHYLVGLVKGPQRTIVRFEIILAVFLFGILAKDLVTHYKHFVHLFIYYYDRALPTSVNPRSAFYALFIPMGLFIGLPMIRRRFHLSQLAGLWLLAAGLTLFCNTWLMPKLTPTYSLAHLWYAYLEHSDGKDPMCAYHSWEERSVSYYSNNKIVYLDSRKNGSETKFFKKPGKLYCMVDHNVYPKLRERVKKNADRDLYIVDSEHPFTYLVATDPPQADKDKPATGDKTFLLDAAPALEKPVEAVWDGKIKLLGWESDKPSYKRGERITLSFYFEALADVGDDWQIFIHGDVVNGGGRMNGDHLPASGRHPTDKWTKGQIVKDVWSGVVPTHLSSGAIEIYLGFFKEEGRMKVESGPDDGDDRVRLGSLTLED